MKYAIGSTYKFPGNDRIFKLKKVTPNHEEDLCMLVYHFECGHYVTDNVFVDMYEFKTQLELF